MEENPCGKEKFSLSLSYDDLFLFLRERARNNNPFPRGGSLIDAFYSRIFSHFQIF